MEKSSRFLSHSAVFCSCKIAQQKLVKILCITHRPTKYILSPFCFCSWRPKEKAGEEFFSKQKNKLKEEEEQGEQEQAEGEQEPEEKEREERERGQVGDVFGVCLSKRGIRKLREWRRKIEKSVIPMAGTMVAGCGILRPGMAIWCSSSAMRGGGGALQQFLLRFRSTSSYASGGGARRSLTAIAAAADSDSKE